VAAAGACGLALVALGAGLPLVLDELPRASLDIAGLALAGALALVAATALAPAAVLVAAFALLPFVRFEPAPVDVAFLVLMLASLGSRRSQARVRPLVALPLALWVVVTALSTAGAADLPSALRFEATTLYLVALAFWLTRALADEAVAQRAIAAYVLTAAGVAAASVVALKVGFPGGDFLLFDAFRIEGLTKDPNVFAPLLVPAAVIVIEDIARPRLLRWSVHVKLLVALALFAGSLFAFSRGAWLNLGVAILTLLAVYTWRRGGLRTALRVLAVVGAAAAVGLAILQATGAVEFLQDRSSAKPYDETRFATQAAVLERAVTSVLGHGPGQVEGAFEQSAHSLFARVAYEQGMIGVALLVLAVGATLGWAILLARRDDDVHGIGSASLLAAWLGLVANSVFVDTLHWRHLWIVAALIWLGYWRATRSAPEARPASPAPAVTGWAALAPPGAAGTARGAPGRTPPR
jgi:hypothetical protein